MADRSTKEVQYHSAADPVNPNAYAIAVSGRVSSRYTHENSAFDQLADRCIDRSVSSPSSGCPPIHQMLHTFYPSPPLCAQRRPLPQVKTGTQKATALRTDTLPTARRSPRVGGAATQLKGQVWQKPSEPRRARLGLSSRFQRNPMPSRLPLVCLGCIPRVGGDASGRR